MVQRSASISHNSASTVATSGSANRARDLRYQLSKHDRLYGGHNSGRLFGLTGKDQHGGQQPAFGRASDSDSRWFGLPCTHYEQCELVLEHANSTGCAVVSGRKYRLYRKDQHSWPWLHQQSGGTTRDERLFASVFRPRPVLPVARHLKRRAVLRGLCRRQYVLSDGYSKWDTYQFIHRPGERNTIHRRLSARAESGNHPDLYSR